ncbi:MAG TPA: aminoacyl-tRNA deacylase [bacterium]|nr:aminoacyl-tRNA deacylase [bacterium]
MSDYPITQAVRALRQYKIDFAPTPYPYEEHGGTKRASQMLHVPEHIVIKTLVMQDENKKPLLVLMHGDCEVSTKQLARELGVKAVTPCDEKIAERLTGYKVGGISPFGVRAKMPVCVEATILELESIHINGGKRGFLVRIDPRDIEKAMAVRRVHVAIEP